MKKLISILMIMIIILSTTSCQGTKQEIDQLSVVLAMGFDLTAENKYLFTVQVLNTKKQPSTKKESSGAELPSDVVIYSMEGLTPNDAFTKLSTEIDKNLFFGHAKYIVIGSDLAKYGLSFFTDVILRGYETRPNNLLLVTKGKASDIITASAKSSTIPANIVESIKKQQSFKGYAPIVSRIDFANSLSHKSVAPIIGVIELTQNSNEAVFKLAGTAVFKEDKLIGYLDMYQTRGMQWIKGKVKYTTLSVPLYGNGFITFDVLKAKSKVKATIIDDTVTIYINIKEQGNIIELPQPINVMETPGAMKELSKVQDKAIETEIKSAIYMAQKVLKADIFDFGGVIFKTNPNYWKKIEDDWDNIFPNLEVKINVDSSLKRPGIISKPIK